MKLIKFLKQNKKTIRVIALVVIAVLITTLGLTYAYIGATLEDAQVTSVNVSLGNMENFSYSSGNTITINETNLTGSTSPSVTMTPGTSETTINSTYDVYFSVEENSFYYTTEAEGAEIFLNVTDPAGNEVTVVDGLERKTSGSTTGFDITEFTGFIPIRLDYPIASNDTVSGTTQNWTFTITYVDLPGEQIVPDGLVRELNARFILKNGELKFLGDQILQHNGGIEYIESKGAPNFNVNANTDEGMFMAMDDYGKSYYFRGAVDNNWVYFAENYWRIIRINGDGSVRLLYAGPEVPNYSTRISRSASIATVYFGPGNSISEHAGYMYQDNEPHGILTDSTIKASIDPWYKTNIEDKGLTPYLSDSLFCNDRTVTSGTGIGSGATEYSGYTRLALETKAPVLTCENKMDRFTVNDGIVGNSILTYPVATITADEILMGGVTESINTLNYLIGNSYWSMTPYNFSGLAQTFYLPTNILSAHTVHTYYAGGHYHGNPQGVRPVINLKSYVQVTGTGEYNDPYIVGDVQFFN